MGKRGDVEIEEKEYDLRLCEYISLMMNDGRSEECNNFRGSVVKRIDLLQKYSLCKGGGFNEFKWSHL